MRKKKNKTKQIAYFLATQNGVPQWVGQEKFILEKKDSITFRKQFFPIKSTKPTFQIGYTQYFLFDITGSGQLLLKDILEAYKKGEINEENKDPYLIPTGQLFLSMD